MFIYTNLKYKLENKKQFWGICGEFAATGIAIDSSELEKKIKEHGIEKAFYDHAGKTCVRLKGSSSWWRETI